MPDEPLDRSLQADHDEDAELVVSPLVVVSRTFAARPSAWVEARDFLREVIGPDVDQGITSRSLYDAVGDALLAAAHPDIGAFQIVVRILPDEVEVEVLTPEEVSPGPPPPGSLLMPTESFANWFTDVLERQGLTQEAAARQLGVSVRTVNRWIRGRTEPRLKDLQRVHSVFGRSG
ncbi:MAG: helix-turn-helix transcriptional regulator [Nocardioides sp.]|nr:helix-turn-helix transcriptional regulator [Nocardioides sp.]